MTPAPYGPISAITSRRSVRTFDASRPLSASTLEQIEAMLREARAPFPAPEAQLRLVESKPEVGLKLGTYGVISGARHFITMAVPSDLTAILAAAFRLESVLLRLQAMGLGSVWIGGTFRRGQFAQAAGFPEGMEMPAVVPVGYPAPPRIVERVMRAFSRASKRKPWSELFFDGTSSAPLTPDRAGKMAQALDMVRLAPSDVNSQPWRVVVSGPSAHFFAQYHGSASASTIMKKRIDMGIALCHFSEALTSAGLEHTITPCTAAPAPAANCPPADWHFIATVTIDLQVQN